MVYLDYFLALKFSKKEVERFVIVDPQFDTYGWKTLLQQRRGTSKITINKNVAVGAGLQKGQFLYCYLAKDEGGRS